MINNIVNVDARMQQTSVVKTNPSLVGVTMPPILGFKTPLKKEKANLRVKKFRRSENIIISIEFFFYPWIYGSIFLFIFS